MFKCLFNLRLGQQNNTNILNECQEDFDCLSTLRTMVPLNLLKKYFWLSKKKLDFSYKIFYCKLNLEA